MTRNLTGQQAHIIDSFNSLDQVGKEYILQALTVAAASHSKTMSEDPKEDARGERPKIIDFATRAAVQEPEKPQYDNLCSAQVVGRILGISMRWVQRYAQDGILKAVDVINEDGEKVKRYDLLPTIQAYTAYLRDQAKAKAN